MDRQSVPHFVVTQLDGRVVRYVDGIWQHRHLVFVSLPRDDRDADIYAASLTEQADRFAASGAVLVVTHDTIGGLGCPGVLIADRYGEIRHAEQQARVRDLISATGIQEWLTFISVQCAC